MGWRSILKVGPDIPSYGTDPGVCKGERKAVLSGGAPSTLAGFAYLIIFFQGIQLKKKICGKILKTIHGLPELAGPFLGRSFNEVKLFPWIM